jgi:glycosyltransferase involved in cell wall biosynthesis
MTIVAITTSVNYADYLPQCLHSLALASVVDSAIVVTKDHDASLEVAIRYGATPVLFDGWHDRDAVFNKAGAVRFGQQQAYAAEPDAWYLVVDADIVMPKNAREVIERHATDAETLYGASRADFHTHAELKAGTPTKAYAGIFAGFFQLYRQHVLYPEWSHSAEACDLAFAKQFASCVMLPMTVGHCGVERVNWEGRRSPLWG